MNDDTCKNLEVWKEAVELAARVCGLFHASWDFGFRDQIRRAAVSISSNIAEGYERDSNPDFIRFLFIREGFERRGSIAYVHCAARELTQGNGRGRTPC